MIQIEVRFDFLFVDPCGYRNFLYGYFKLWCLCSSYMPCGDLFTYAISFASKKMPLEYFYDYECTWVFFFYLFYSYLWKIFRRDGLASLSKYGMFMDKVDYRHNRYIRKSCIHIFLWYCLGILLFPLVQSIKNVLG